MDARDPSLTPLLLQAATHFGITIDELRSLGGETNMVFAAGDRVVSLGDAADLKREVLAASAASAVLTRQWWRTRN